MREQLESVERQTGIRPPQLNDLVELPPEYQYVYEDFQRLSSTRPAGFGVSPITYTEMQAYYGLMGIIPEPWEIMCIKAFDSATLSEYAAQQEKNNNKQKSE